MDPAASPSHPHSLRRWALATGLTALAAKQTKGIRMLMHHGVDSVFTAQALDEQITWIKDRFPILSFGEVVDRLRNRQPLPDFAVVLTFDDGLRNNVTAAYPVLLKHQVPATFFVCPGLIESGQWVWTYEMRLRLATLSPEQMGQLASDCFGRPTTVTDSFIGQAKKQDNARRVEVVEAVRAATADYKPTAAHREQRDLASWDELATLDQRLITIGGHTMSHPILASVADDAVEYELGATKKALVERGLMKADHSYLCYPDGSFDDRSQACAKRLYAAACCTQKSIITSASPLYALPRIGANSALPDVAWRLWRPRG